MAFNNFGNRFQQTTPAVLNLIIINVIVFIAQLMFRNATPSIDDLFALHHYKSSNFRLYQVITHMFMHASFLHILLNMYALWMFGSFIERVWGPKRFLIFYFLCGLGSAVAQLISFAYEFRGIGAMPANADQYELYSDMVDMVNATVVGASGAIMGVVAAFGYLFPNTQMMIIPIPIPIKAKWLVIGYVAFDLFSGIAARPGDDVAHFAHVGGALTGFLIVFFQNRFNKKTFY